MRIFTFASRNTKEITRDILTLIFGIAFPIVLLLLLSAINKGIPEGYGPDIFMISKLAPGITVFGLSFLALFSSMMALVQTAVCYICALFLGLPFSVNLIVAVFVNLPIAIVFISLGLLFGSILNEKAVGGVCGALLTNLSAWCSNIWFDTAMVGGAFKTVADLLPFSHAVNAARAAVAGDFAAIFPDLWWVIGYAVVLLTAAVTVFAVKLKKN